MYSLKTVSVLVLVDETIVMYSQKCVSMKNY